MIPRRTLGVALLVLTMALALPEAGRTQGMASAGLRVAAHVGPVCSIFTSAPETTPSIRLRCGRSELRAIRVSLDSGEDLAGVRAPASRQWLSGGEVVFPLTTALAVVASRNPVASLPRHDEPASLVVTLHF